jgi:hypothetical protein
MKAQAAQNNGNSADAANNDPMAPTTIVRRPSKSAAVNEEDEDLKKSSRMMFRVAFSSVIFYMALGTVCYMTFAKMKFVNAFYFVIVTLTTVGYGDQCSMTSCGKCEPDEEDCDAEDSVWSEEALVLFTAFYALIGIMLMSAGLGIIAAELVAAHDAAIKAAQEASQRSKQEAAVERRKSQVEISSSPSNAQVRIAQTMSQTKGAVRKTARDTKAAIKGAYTGALPEPVAKLVPSILKMLFVLFLGMLLIYFDSDREISWSRAFYFAVVTGTTIGYGDISPGTTWGRSVSIVYLLVAVVSIGNVLSSVAGAFVDYKQRQTLEKILAKKITLEDFEKFDVDGDGKIEKMEFVVRKLMLMGLLNSEDVERVEEEFEVMDHDGSGEITMEDLDAYLHEQEDEKGS